MPNSEDLDTILPVNIEEEMQASYLDYAMSVIIGRALPDVRDGLKPVHRRVLFAMHDLGNTYNRSYKKSARVVGDVIGKYHPHGDQAVYDTLVRMAQEFSLRHPLVDGQGNFGSIDGDNAAAMRYTEVRMAKLTTMLLADLDKETVEFSPNYDESLHEPKVLPTRFPNLLINGSSGIAVGMATNIPPHNLTEVVDATIALARNPELTTVELMQFVPAPDFPTHGIIYGAGNLRKAYETGRGSIKIRGRAQIEEGPKRDRIVITEIPYQVNKSSMIEKMADLIRDKRVVGISDIRDESNRDGIRVVIDLKRDGNAEVILNQLYAMTQLQTSFGFNMVSIVNGQPQLLGMKPCLMYFLKHRREVVTRRCRYELREANKRFNVVFGLLAAIDSIDRIITLIRASKDQPEAKAALMREVLPVGRSFRTLCEELLTFDFAQGKTALSNNEVRLNERQAQAILDMRLARLTGLERDKLAVEAAELRDVIARLVAILADDALLLQVIIDELEAVREEYGEPRRSEIAFDTSDIDMEDLIPEEETVVTVSHLGYVKRNPIEMYAAQRRGGKGKTATTTREEDFVERMFVASTHSTMLVFTDKGKVYWLKVYNVPQSGRNARGKPLVNLINIDQSEKVAAILPIRDFPEDRFLMFTTAKGYIKKTDLASYARQRSNGLIALTIDEDDALVKVGLTDGSNDVVIATSQGMAIRFPESNVRAMGRTARGVRAITLKKEGDHVVGMVICNDDAKDVLTVTNRGYGKRTAIDEYRHQSRGGSGVINCKLTDKTGLVAGVVGVRGDEELMVLTDGGMMIRMPIDQISKLSRSTQGVRVITVKEGEVVTSIASLDEAEGAEGLGSDNADETKENVTVQ